MPNTQIRSGSKRRIPAHWRAGGGFHKDRYDKSSRTFRPGAKAPKRFGRKVVGRIANAALQSATGGLAPDLDEIAALLHDNNAGEGDAAGPSRDRGLDAEMLSTDDEDDTDMNIRNSTVGGKPNSKPSHEPTFQRCMFNEGQNKWERRTIESTYIVQYQVSGGYDPSKTLFVPWESIAVCHNTEQFYRAFGNSWYWRPISADVNIFDFKAHVAVPISSSSFYPIGLNQVKMRHADQSYPWLASRSRVFDDEAQYTGWIAMCQDQSTGTPEKQLPVTTLKRRYMDTHVKAKYDDDYWVEERITDGTIFNFHHDIPIGNHPWRHQMDITGPQRVQLDAQGSGTSVDEYMIFNRFDYFHGMLDEPSASRYKDGAANPINRCYVNRSTGNHYISNVIKDRTSMTEATDYYQLPDDAKTHNALGRNVIHKNISDTDIIYRDNHQMKPILLSFSKFMNNAVVQAYTVYFTVRIVHTIEIMLNNQYTRTHLDGAVQLNGITSDATSWIYGKFPLILTTSKSDTDEQDQSDKKFKEDIECFPIYNPTLWPVWTQNISATEGTELDNNNEI